MFTFSHSLRLEARLFQNAPRRSEWEEIEQFDGPLLTNQEPASPGLFERLARGLERLDEFGNSFRSAKDTSLLEKGSYRKVS
ncbi:MAG: hypothetical protein IOD12_08720 [Silvanigrellales bacterium]|nr:hypothetical protein [Silvanigrellales bacterium]